MGTRLAYQIGTYDSHSITCAVLYTNSRSEKIDAEAIFRKEAELAIGPNDLVIQLMRYHYPSDDSTGLANQPVFCVTGSVGDVEKVFWAKYDTSTINKKVVITEHLETRQEILQSTVNNIVTLLSGKEWDSETTSDIAETLRNDGYEILDCN
jgi:hypothetical protein